MIWRNFLTVTATILTLAGCGRSPAPTPREPAPQVAEARMPTPPQPIARQPVVAPAERDVPIGLLLPLSGPDAAVGAQLRDAAMLALYDKRASLSRQQMKINPRLVVRDVAGGPEVAAKMAQELVDSGVQIILGPLLVEDVKTAGVVARAAKVPMIAFSNNIVAAQPGVFIYGFRPGEQVERIADYALKQQIATYASLAPQSEYGRAVVGEFSARVQAQGKTLQPVNFFTTDAVPPATTINRLVDTVKERGAERQGIFLPVTGQPLAAISAQLMTAKGVNPAFVKLLGTGVWDDDQLRSLPSMNGAWFASTPPDLSRKFEQRFQSTYGYAPIRVASLSYDAVALVTTLALQPGVEKFDPQLLTDPMGYAGPANGIFRLLPDGRTERALAVIEMTPRGPVVVDPAPRKFGMK